MPNPLNAINTGTGTSVIQRGERRAHVARMLALNYQRKEIWAELQRLSRVENKPYLAVTERTINSDQLVVMDQLREATIEAGAAIRERLALKIQAVERRARPMLDDDDPRVAARGGELIIKCVDRLSKLYGADAPTQIEVAEIDDHIRVEVVTRDQWDQSVAIEADADDAGG